jgi:hypothetical protein
MKYVCDAPGGHTWFRLENDSEAAQESSLMGHAVEKFFRREWEKAAQSFVPASKLFIEQDIGRRDHIQREMPLFATLRNDNGDALATAMLPPGGKPDPSFTSIIVGPKNSDPFTDYRAAIDALGKHFGLQLDRERCYPYRRY